MKKKKEEGEKTDSFLDFLHLLELFCELLLLLEVLVKLRIEEGMSTRIEKERRNTKKNKEKQIFTFSLSAALRSEWRTKFVSISVKGLIERLGTKGAW